VRRHEGEDSGPPPGTGADLDWLLGAVAKEDHAAFERIYVQLREGVYRTVRAVLRDPAQSEEVTQEVFLELWCTAVHFDPVKGNAAAWVFLMARRRAIDRVRSVVASVLRDQRHAPDAGLWDQTHEAAAEALDRERLARCLDRLSAPQLQAITLAFYGGHTYSQVADILGVPLGTVKGRIRDALGRLRDDMLSGG
jgi:RNA polymerase sigma-70 factor (ECF subfamily)